MKIKEKSMLLNENKQSQDWKWKAKNIYKEKSFPMLEAFYLSSHRFKQNRDNQNKNSIFYIIIQKRNYHNHYDVHGTLARNLSNQ